MGIPSRLVSVCERYEPCRFWKLVKVPDHRGWVNRYGLSECTKPTLCPYNTTDARVGGCIICGNVAKIPGAERP